MQWQEELSRELRFLEDGLTSKRSDLEKSVDTVEAKYKERENEQKNNNADRT